MSALEPADLPELSEALLSCAGQSQSIRLGGHFSKNSMGGPLAAAQACLTTRKLNRVLEYEPRDLTISVQAGLSYRELTALLAGNGQMLPLDPPLSATATVGGVLATNCSGPRRRQFGTARDMLIGMQFVTLQGKVIQSGGMVVKNVAGLDMAKLMIGSFGTLAAIGVANFKVVPVPPRSRTFVLSFSSLKDAMARRDAILRSVAQPAAIDLVNAPAAQRLNIQGPALLLRVGASEILVARYTAEFGGDIAEGEQEARIWEAVEEFVPHFLEQNPEGVAVRVSSTLTAIGQVQQSLSVPGLSRAGSGITYACFPHWEAAQPWLMETRAAGMKAVIEFAPPEGKSELPLWEPLGKDFAIMEKIKRMFDPQGLLNRGRLYGRI
jgi:glycolate oxidase FAD binding subunit